MAEAESPYLVERMHGFGTTIFAEMSALAVATGSINLGQGFPDEDLVDTLERLLPRDDRYRHAHGSAGHGADHVLPAIVAPTVVLPVQAGEPLLGIWQSVVFVDLNRDNPRRNVRLSFVAG